MSDQHRHAEVVGGGFAGLTVSIALARKGWSVRLHEQKDQLRGHPVVANAMLVLHVIGVADTYRAALPDVYEYPPTSESLWRSPDSRTGRSPGRGCTPYSQPPHATAASSSSPPRARPEPIPRALLLEDGTRLEADLVVATAGPVRLQLAARARAGTEQSWCLGADPPPRGVQGSQVGPGHHFWTRSDAMRILFIPTGPDTIYMGMMAATGNERAARIPIDVVVRPRRFLISRRPSNWRARPRAAAMTPTRQTA